MIIQQLLKENHNIDFNIIHFNELEHVINLINSILNNDFSFLRLYTNIYIVLTTSKCRYVKYYILEKIISNHSHLLKNHEYIINNFRYYLFQTFLQDETKYKLCFDTCSFYNWVLMQIYHDFHNYDEYIKNVIFETTMKHFNDLEYCRYHDNTLTNYEYNLIIKFINNTLDKLYNFILIKCQPN